MYIITDVMKANRITACVTSDDDTVEVISTISVPIGFGYSKFRLTPEGLVAEQVTPPFFQSAILRNHFLFFLTLPPYTQNATTFFRPRGHKVKNNSL